MSSSRDLCPKCLELGWACHCKKSAQPKMSKDIEEIARLAERVKRQVAEGDGHWRTCSGCYETSDGYNVNGHPHSAIFDCTVGSGCLECGGLGAVWDDTDYEDWARWMIAQDQRAALNNESKPVARTGSDNPHGN